MRGSYGLLRELEPKQRPRRPVGEENKDEDKTRQEESTRVFVEFSMLIFFLFDLKVLRLTNRKTEKGLEEK